MFYETKDVGDDLANLTYQEKTTLEELFGMSSGYVMDFTNNSFAKFVGGTINLDIYNSPGYKEYTSKANKLRQIWSDEPDAVVGTLIEALLSYYEDMRIKKDELTDYDRKKIGEMRLVASRLKGNSPHIELPNKQEDSFQTLQEDIRKALGRNKPELVLDRLHTYSTKLIRQICADNGLAVADDKGDHYPLHSLAGMLRKKYEQDGLFQSSFTLVAIKNSISLFDNYNSIRNSQSYAHDNEVLGTLEAEFAVKIMADFISFIDKAEAYRKRNQKTEEQNSFFDELPF